MGFAYRYNRLISSMYGFWQGESLRASAEATTHRSRCNMSFGTGERGIVRMTQLNVVDFNNYVYANM